MKTKLNKSEKVNKEKNKRTRTLRFFLSFFALICFFSVSTIWINFLQFKSASETDSYKLSKFIAVDVKDRYESANKFILAVEPFVTDTMRSILLSMENEIKSIGTVDNVELQNLKKEYNITNIYVLDEQGKVKYSTVQSDIGTDSAQLYENRTDIDWQKVFKDVQQSKEIYVDKFSQSSKYPYDFNKLAYKGLGYIDNVGFVVLEISLSISDIKDQSVADLISSLKNIDKENDNIVDVSFENSPPGTDSTTYFKESNVKNGNKYIAKMNIENISDGISQVTVTTKFDEIDSVVTSAFYNAIINSIFIIAMMTILSIMFYYRFSLPTQNSAYKVALQKTIEELKQINKE